MARIAIIGPGAVGGVMAAWLDHTHRHDLVLCARRAVPALTVATADREFFFHPTVITDPARGAPADWVLVTTKAYDAAGAAAWLPKLGDADTPVAILQNGVEHRERFSPFLAPERIVPVMVDCPAERIAPDKILQRGRGKMVVANDAYGREFAALFTGTELEVALTDDFKTAVWRKLGINAVGALSAILLKPVGIMRDEGLADIGRGLVSECVAVGRAEGAVLEDELPEKVLQACWASPPDSVNSLQADRAAGRPMEVDARNGAIVRLGRKHGIATPYNQMAVALLTASTLP